MGVIIEGDGKLPAPSTIQVTGGLRGIPGQSVELQVASDHIQWRLVGDPTWINLLPLTMLGGENGTDGREVELRNNGTYVQWRYVGDVSWTNLIPLADISGTDGDNGLTPELQKSSTHIQWKYTTDVSWIDLVALTDLKGQDATNVMTAAGDMIYATTGGDPARLAKGTDGQLLSLTAGVPDWVDPVALAPVATSGDYADLTGKPTIPSTPGEVGAATAAQGTKADTAVQPGDLADVATSGDYNDLLNLPAIPDSPDDIGAATAAQGAKADAALQPAAIGVSVASLVSGLVPSGQLPSYVDDVLEYANYAALPGTGESGKIYVLLTPYTSGSPAVTSSQFRWTGSTYAPIVASPGSTDAVTEGSTNLYFTAARVLAVILTGLSTATSAAITASDSVLSALGKLQAQITSVLSSISNVNNTSDANKPVSTAQQTALDLKAPLASPTFTGTVAGITKSMVGLGSVDNTSDTAKPVSTAQQTALDAKADLASPTFTGTVAGITKSMVGLGSVDNTADTAKPVSTAQQTALDAKANLASPTFTGTVSGITKAMVGLSNVDNTADTAKPVSTAQQTALDLKANLASPTFTGTVAGITKAMVGLGSADNTADTAKPVSTAQQTALDAKLNLSGGALTGALNEAPTVTLASASTVNIGAAASNTVAISGTTTITAFDTVADGITRKIRFTGAMLLTYNATSLILPTSANITTANGDTAVAQSLGSGNWKILSYNKADGTALSGLTNPMTASGDIIYGGTSGAATRLAKGTNGQTLSLASSIPAWVTVGMAAACASGDDYPLFDGFANYTGSALNSTTRSQLNVVYIDSMITVTNIVLAISTAASGKKIDVGIYNYLSAGKPGTCVASASFSTTSTGRISVALGSATTFNPGLYFIMIHGDSTSSNLITLSTSASLVGVPLAGLVISNLFTRIAAGTTTTNSVLMDDVNLPGGAYSIGMNLTGLDMKTSTIVGFNTWTPCVGLTKQ